MAIFKAGRLKRTLTGITGIAPLFALYSEPTGPIYDDDIHSVVIHRGKSGRGGGYQASTMEATVRGRIGATLSGENCRFFLRDSAAAALGTALGVDGTKLAMRYQGRVGKLSVEDTGKRYTTTVYAASWLARLLRAKRTTTPLTGQTISRVFTDVLNLANPPAGVTLTFAGTWDTVARNQDPLTFSDALGKFGSDIGTYFREMRDGATQAWTLPYRGVRATAMAATNIPLTRSQAISPATWEQANEYPALTLNYKMTNTSGVIVTHTAEVATGDPLQETEEVDWSHIKSPDDGQLYMEAYGRVYSSATRNYSIPSLTIDLLYLMGSDKQYHRDQAAQLLAMECGDPVYFSGDWLDPLRGVHFAEGITETIGPNEWTLTLSLVRYAHALGLPVQPTIRPRVWDSFTNQWNQETQKWNEA